MTDKEFKRLNRAQLIEIIYQLQLQVDELTEKTQSLEQALEDKHLRISNVGNLAQAALEMNNCFQSAQNAAEQYLEEIKALHEEAKAEKQRILAQAKADAAAMVSNTGKSRIDYELAIEEILREREQKRLDDGGAI